jgi:hypothetical protein
MSANNRPLPHFLVGIATQEAYDKWIERKAANQARRDQNRFGRTTSGAAYRQAIHQAVLKCEGKDVYTGEQLDWSLIGQYNNDESKAGKHKYKGQFSLLPTVDHIDASSPTSDLCICAWRTNDSKHDMSTTEFLNLCEKVLIHHGRKVT